jgi:hypothetical protein
MTPLANDIDKLIAKSIVINVMKTKTLLERYPLTKKRVQAD